MDWVAKLEVIPPHEAQGRQYDEQGRYWDNHTNQDEIDLYRAFWQQGWLQETHPQLEEGWIVNAYGERIR
eukprot:12725229-Prorocentrum_lima.AAC.1